MSGEQTLTRALRHRPFLALWIGNTVSAFGDSLHRLALAWWVMKETGSGFAMGIALACTMVPMVPFLLIGGALVDRFDRVKIMLVSDIARAVLVGAFALLMALDRLELWHVYALSFAFGTFDAFFVPALQAVLPSLVPRDDLPSANSLRAVAKQLASILGPMLGALVISIGQGYIVFVIDAMTFVISAIAIAQLLRLDLSIKRDESENVSVISDIRDGMSYVRNEPWLWISIVAFLFINFAEIPLFSVVVTYIVLHVYQSDATVFAVMEALASAGTIGGAIWLGRRARLKNRGKVVYVWVILSGVFGLACGFPVGIVGLGVLVFLGGLSGTMIVLVWTSLMQDRVPSEQLGRVWSIDTATAVITMPIGTAVFGWALDQFDLLAVCVAGGVLVMVAGGLALMHPKIREID
jgi:MFS family permease